MDMSTMQCSGFPSPRRVQPSSSKKRQRAKRPRRPLSGLVVPLRDYGQQIVLVHHMRVGSRSVGVGAGPGPGANGRRGEMCPRGTA
jgi:hypothetical protein